jgi:tRNA(Arg) A34 adenosine deaminase TadA
MKKALLNEAYRIALRNLETHPEYEHYAHFSFIVKDNQIVEWATNNAHTPPKHYGYGSRIKGAKPKTHSEIMAYKRARRIIGRANFEVINIRLNRSKQLRLSKPCVCCDAIMKALGCTKIYYSWEGGFIKDA